MLFTLLYCALIPTVTAQGVTFSNILRSVTGAIGTQDSPPKANQSNQTAVLGVRGMDEEDAKTARPAAGSVKQLESWAVSRKEAESAAAQRGLKARSVDYATVSSGTSDPQVAR